jgi:rhamnose utilization protein RhaD (predicted bifunctional aldolase and dehydrogenase)
MVELDDLRQLSAKIGANPLLVQAAGGNTSLKQDGVMWIKASGTWLRDAAQQDIFVPLDYAKLRKALQNDDPACESCTDFVRNDLNANKLRPSIETSLHGLMPQRVVVHVHCVNTIAWAIRRDAKARLREKLVGFNWYLSPMPVQVCLSPKSLCGSLSLTLMY